MGSKGGFKPQTSTVISEEKSFKPLRKKLKRIAISKEKDCQSKIHFEIPRSLENLHKSTEVNEAMLEYSLLHNLT